MANLNIIVNTEYNGRGIRDAQRDFENSQRTIQQLRDRIKDLNQVLSNIRPNSTQFIRYAAEVRSATDALTALQQRARTVGNTLPTSMGGATSSVIEFNRVIQDAPFGIQGVGNNIQALTQNFAYLINQTGSARRATSLFFSTLITPANLAVLAVSAITTAWTIYNTQQQKATKAAAEAAKNIHSVTEEINGQVDTLSVLDRVSIKASSSSSEQGTVMKTLYGITQDLTMSMKERNRAADQLQKLYPSYFANQTNEAILTGNSAKAYENLTNVMLATSQARAALSISDDNNKELLKIQIERNSRLKDEATIQNQINKLRSKGSKLGIGSGQLDSQNIKNTNFLDDLQNNLGNTSLPFPGNGNQKQQEQVLKDLYNAYKQLNLISASSTDVGVREIKLTQEQYELRKKITDEVKKGADITGQFDKDFTQKAKTPKSTPTDVIKGALQNSTDQTGLEGLDGVDKQLEKLTQEYADYYRAIDKYTAESAKRGVNVTDEAEKAKSILLQQNLQRRNQIELAEETRVASEVQRIRDDSGIAAEQNIEKDFATLTKWYNAEVDKAAGNSDIMTAIEEGLQARRDAIRKKYYDKYAADIDKLTQRISGIEEQGFTQNKTGLAAETKKLQTEIDKRIAKVNELYDAMLKVNQDGLAGQALIFGLRAASTAGVKNKGAEAQNSQDYQSAKALNAAVGDFTSKMYDNLSNIGKKNAEITDKYNQARAGATDAEIVKLNAMEKQEKALANSFGSIFSSIFDTFTNSMNSLFKTTLTNLLKTTFSKGLDNLKFPGLSNTLSSALVAGVALAGNAISSIGGGKNTFTSALGGGLTGAASGAVLGTAIGGPAGTVPGAIIGGLVGAIGGIFGSSSKRKQEQLQEQQLAEQKKTNALLDRQSRLSYSSAIIGRQSERGIISAVDVNEFGQLTTTISGNTIVLAYDRTKQAQSRGM